MKKFRNIVYILLIILIMISIVPKQIQNDTFFTISIGRNVIKSGLSDVDKLTFHDNLKFPHSGIFDIFITLIYEKFNFLGIYIFVITISIIQGLLYYYVLSKITKKYIFSFFITVISMYFLRNSFTGRAQIFSNLFLLIEFYCLEMIKISEDIKKRYIFCLIIIPIIFANVHSSTFPIYLIVFLPYIAEYILSKHFFISKKETRLIFKVKNIKILFILFLFGLISGFITLTGPTPYTDMFKAMKGISSDFIAELQPLTIYSNMYLTSIIIITISILVFTKQKIRVSDGLFILGFSLLAMNTSRSIYYVILISSICLVRVFVDFLSCYNFNIRISNKFRILLEIMSIIIILLHTSNIFIRNIAEDYIVYDQYPVKATKYIKDNLDINNMRIYNHFNFGSYLEFKGIKAFIDSRSGVFTTEFNPGCTILQDWMNVSNLEIDYNEIFDKYKINYLLLYSSEPLARCVKLDPKWHFIYQDNSFILYEKVKK